MSATRELTNNNFEEFRPKFKKLVIEADLAGTGDIWEDKIATLHILKLLHAYIFEGKRFLIVAKQRQANAKNSLKEVRREIRNLEKDIWVYQSMQNLENANVPLLFVPGNVAEALLRKLWLERKQDSLSKIANRRRYGQEPYFCLLSIHKFISDWNDQKATLWIPQLAKLVDIGRKTFSSISTDADPAEVEPEYLGKALRRLKYNPDNKQFIQSLDERQRDWCRLVKMGLVPPSAI